MIFFRLLVLYAVSQIAISCSASSTRPQRSYCQVKLIPAPKGAIATELFVDDLWAEVLSWNNGSAIAIISRPQRGTGGRDILYRKSYIPENSFLDLEPSWSIINASWSPSSPFFSYQVLSLLPWKSTISVLDLNSKETIDMQDLIRSKFGNDIQIQMVNGKPEWTGDGKLLFVACLSKYTIKHFDSIEGLREGFRIYSFDPINKFIEEK
jgi:hypothetical protein